MCSPIRCQKCNKTTWTGCGSHVDEVKARVPDDQWCSCDEGSSSQQGSTRS